MRWISERRPSPAMVVSLIALVIAASGSAVAATRLISGDKLIRKNSLSGNRLRDHTVSARQINLASLGAIPTASHASTADTATNASHANTADNATNANAASHATTADNATHAKTADTATNADNATSAQNADSATNASHADTADSATNASHADTADSATSAISAANASALGGSPASAFQLACRQGAIAAYAYVKGSATFSSSYTSANPPVQDPFNCTGGIVEVKRTGTGVYDVHFGGLDSGKQLIAVGTQTVDPLGVAVNGGEVTYKLVFDASVKSGAGGTVYQVRLDDTGSSLVDNEFSFALLSPT